MLRCTAHAHTNTHRRHKVVVVALIAVATVVIWYSYTNITTTRHRLRMLHCFILLHCRMACGAEVSRARCFWLALSNDQRPVRPHWCIKYIFIICECVVSACCETLTKSTEYTDGEKEDKSSYYLGARPRVISSFTSVFGLIKLLLQISKAPPIVPSPCVCHINCGV